MSIIGVDPVLGALPGQELDIVGKVLGDGEALESIGDQIFIE
jgi:hypothetical protein